VKGVEWEVKTAAAVSCTLAATARGSSAVATAAPSGFANFGNAQDTIDALAAAGYNVQINGANVFKLSTCIVIQVEGLSNSNIDAKGNRDPPN
jgi:hypothetical protein